MPANGPGGIQARPSLSRCWCPGNRLRVTVWNRKSAVPIPKSVAVLPFENLSHDPDNAYFAEGIQEEILTRLAGIADLKVISRTSTQRYQSKPHNLAEIAKQLGVANILEGSVQKAADQVRVNVQLINAQMDSHLWADSYDRKLTDILGVESEVAKGIAESLEAKFTGREEQALAVKPTNNPEAYDAYLRGLAFERHHILTVRSRQGKRPVFNGRCSLTRNLRSLGHGFPVQRLALLQRPRYHSLSAGGSETCSGEFAETGAQLA